ncbi:MAG: choice-of-anchor H family protein [Pseudomonadota bacterium]
MQNSYARQRGLPLVVQTASIFLAAVMSLSYASVASAADEEAAAETRVSLTHKGEGEARSTRDYASTSTDEFPALETNTQKDGASQEPRKPSAASDQQESAFGDYWIYSVDVELFNDSDRDGFFHGIDLLFDADTVYAIADVYAVAYLSYEGGPWNEYAVSPDITLFGSTSTDDYVLVTELLTGYPSGRYDILIELYESSTGLYVASAGPSESFELVDLPLEDANRDQPQQPVSVTRGGGGASNTAFLIALLAVLLLLKQRDRGHAHRGNES